MKTLKKAATVGLALAVTLTTLGFGNMPSKAGGMPSTDGHDKYVDHKVFDVIEAVDFGSKELDAPLFDKSKGSQDIKDLQVPTLAYDDTSIGVVWQKPEKYDNVVDYNVYINGVKKETARENFSVNAEWASKYIGAFYDYYVTQGKSDVDMVNVDIHSYRASGLKADTEYTFKVVAVDAHGRELGTAKEIKQRTTKAPEVFNIKDYGAKTSEGYTTYNDEINAFVVENTKAIQSAFDACTPGGKVVIPEGTYVSGALWLKSDMTLEINGTLWSSPNSDHFEIGFLMYPFYTDTRGWGLINANSSDENQPLENIRVTGTGSVYGNGWKYGSGDTIYKDGFTPNYGDSATKASGDVDFTQAGNEKYALPRWVGGNNQKVFWYGIQAADSARKYLSNVMKEDGTRKYDVDKIASLEADAKADGKVSGIDSTDLTNAYATRSSLVIMRNVTNVYLGDVTIMNPANHSVNILDSRNIATTNVKVFSFDGNNADGLGFGCSQNVICWNNFTDTGDDNLGFGSSVGEGARDSDIQTNSEIWMFNNFIREGHGGLAAGSHTGNGIQDVLFEDTVMNHVDMAFRFKSAPTNGGFAANITMRDCAIADTQQAWVLTTSYSDPNSASSTEYADVGRFYNFASYNISVYGVQNNTIQVLADVDPVNNPQKPWHTHSNLYFQDVTFGNVGTNGSFKNMNGWETLIGCENAVFYNFKTVSFNSSAVSRGTDKTWNNLQYCKNIVFQGTTWDSVNAQTEKMRNIMTGITVTDSKIKAENSAVDAGGESTKGDLIYTWDNKKIIGAFTTPDKGLTTVGTKAGASAAWKEGSNTSAPADFGTKYASPTGDKALDADGVTQSKGTIPVSGSFIKYTADKDAILSICQRTQAKKSLYAVNSDGAVVALLAVPEGSADVYSTIDVPVVKGKTYYIYANGATAMIFKMYLSEKVETGGGQPEADPTDGRSVKLTWNAVSNGSEPVIYGVDTYIGNQKVDTVDGIAGTETTMSRLSSGVAYTFKVYVSEKGDNANSMSLTGWNKTYLGEVKFTTAGGQETVPIAAPETVSAITNSSYYTHTQASWTNISQSDARVRGYKVYVNGNLKKTIYNYEIAKYTSASNVVEQVGRLTPGMENNIDIVAFTDSGLEYKLSTTAETLKNYDYKAPVFAAKAKFTAAEQKNGDVILTWDAATDDTEVGGYRIYVDGKAVLGTDGKAFNPVNGVITTDKTTYTVKGLDLTKTHSFTIQAGDTWWKAAQSMGTFDKMAGYNWTIKGISTNVIEKPEVPTEKPTVAPTQAPSVKPTETPTVAPTQTPTAAPTTVPTQAPTVKPTETPTVAPTVNPTAPTQEQTSKDAAVSEEKKAVVSDFSGKSYEVKLVAPEGVLTENTSLKAFKVDNGAFYEAAQKVFDKNNSRFEVFDLSLEWNNEKVQPKGQVQISIDVPAGYDASKVTVYRIETDGSKTNMKAAYSDGRMVFVTDHFSLYAIVEEGVAQNSGAATGDRTNGRMTVIYMASGILAIGAALAFKKKKRA